jgi:hypothetical protein
MVDGVVTVIQDIPVRVLSVTDMADYQEPLLKKPEVGALVPPALLSPPASPSRLRSPAACLKLTRLFGD